MSKSLFHRGLSWRALKKCLHSYWPPTLLVIIVSILAYLNFQPGTILSGWDNLHPEFNLSLNLLNSIFSVWQERGTGFLVGMAPAADLPRLIIIYLSTHYFQIPVELVRYGWTFLCLGIGTLSTYFLLNHIFLKPKFDPQTKRIASFLGSLFYLLNLSTVQYFYIPFEAFSSFFAFFPLIILATTLYFEKPSLKEYQFLLFSLTISAPAFFVQTLFVVLLICIFPLFINYFRRKPLNAIIFGLTLLATQSYWLLPQIFYVFTHASDVSQSHINLISSPETLYRNLEFASLRNIALLKGFWFNIVDTSSSSKFEYLFLVWRNHINNPIIASVGYLSFALVITGASYALKKSLPFAKSFFAIFLLCVFFLMGGIKIVGTTIPILGELFRSPFTKFSVPLSLSFSLFISVGVIFLFDIFSFLHHRLTYLLTLFTVSIALILYSAPAFTGNLISPLMRVQMPSTYQELFSYFSTVDSATRIANFPQNFLWGWNYYNYGYRGAGFLWYGIRQPILDRGFDVWEKSNENYYEQITKALYSEDNKLFTKTLDDYKVSWLLVDKNIIATSKDNDLGLAKLAKLIDNNPLFEKTFSSSDSQIEVYRFKPTQNVKNFLSTTDQLDTQLSPFALPSLRPQTNFVFDQNSLSLAANIPAGKIILPSLSDSEELLPYTVSYRKTPKGIDLLFSPQTPLIYINDKVVNLDRTPLQVNFEINNPSGSLVLGMNDYFLELQLPDEVTYQNEFSKFTTIYLPTNKAFPLELYSGSPVLTKDITTALQNATPQDCYVHKPNRKIEKVSERDQVTLITTDNVACLSAAIPPATSADQIISLEFVYSSDTNIPGNANITNAQLDSQTIPQPLKPSNTPTYTKLYSRPLFENMYANLLLEANELKSSQTITYKQIKVKYYDRLANSIPTLPPIRTNTLESTSSAILTVSLPTPNSKLLTIQNASNNLLGEEVRNCDNFNEGKVSQSIDLQGLTLESTNAIACKQLNLRHLPHNLNYVIVADHRYIEGLSSTICFENHATRRCDVFERLLKTDKPQLLINPIRNPSEHAGYTLHLFNQSVGSQSTKNLFQSLAIIPVPLTWLEKISVNQATPPATKSVESTHPAEFIYTVHFSDPKEQILNLYQTKSLHWLALEVDDNFHKLPLASQILDLPLQVYRNSSKLILNTDHSNWHNAFKLSNQNQNLVIFYWPQYLQFLGFILLPFPLILMLLISLFKFVKKTIKKSSR